MSRRTIKQIIPKDKIKRDNFNLQLAEYQFFTNF
jgi:hypothetical protein